MLLPLGLIGWCNACKLFFCGLRLLCNSIACRGFVWLGSHNKSEFISNLIMLFYSFFKREWGKSICYFSRQITSGGSKKGLKAVIFMDSVLGWRQTGGRELSSRASFILGSCRLCWPGWSHKGSCAVWTLSCAPPTGLSCTAQQVVFWPLKFYFTALTTQRDLI